MRTMLVLCWLGLTTLTPGCSQTPVRVIVVPYDVRGLPGTGGIPIVPWAAEEQEKRI